MIRKPKIRKLWILWELSWLCKPVWDQGATRWRLDRRRFGTHAEALDYLATLYRTDKVG